MRAFWLSLFIAFWAVMGDKTQFIALAYATRYSLRDVLLGILWSTAAVHLVSVAAGSFIGAWIPPGYIDAFSALCFLIFAVWTFYEKEEKENVRETRQHPILLIGVTFFLAELGDKTMLAAAALATSHPWVPVWLGTTGGMVASDGLAVWVGRSLGKKIPEKIVKWIAIVLFTVFAVWYGFRAAAALR
jgi:putative Ca2+/H+ antiporter (TMEM165/GDT1 family)